MATLLKERDESGVEDVVAGTGNRGDDRWFSVARQVVSELFGPPSERSFAVRYWNGFVEHGAAASDECRSNLFRPRLARDEGKEPSVSGVSPVKLERHEAFGLVLNRPGTLRRMFLPASELSIAESFIRGDFDITGSVEQATAVRSVLGARLRSPRRIARLVKLLRRLPANDHESESRAGFRPFRWFLSRRHARQRDAAAIRFHYDVGNEFYALWLDEQRVYSCAYFTPGHDDLDRAQTAKLEYICRKLRLAPGERFLDIGCGWGALVRHAARHYGVEALGITLSPSQAGYARERISREGLDARCQVQVCDYRDLVVDRPFDKVASVGMFEHVGLRQLDTYFQTVFRLTRPGGLFLNHGIITLGGARERRFVDRLLDLVWRSGSFVNRYVFPDSELVPLAEVTSSSESAGWETRDVESLREHYARTLRHWLRRLEAKEEAAVAIAGAETFRIWRLNMGASADAFSGGRVGVVQVLLARPDENGWCLLPSTREDLYRRAGT